VYKRQEAVSAKLELIAELAVNAKEADVTEPVMKLVAQLAVPNRDPVRSVAVTRPTIVAEPDTFKLPVIVCVLAVEFPKILDPELNTTEELTVVTTKV
jgi:hypothetical protein